MLALATMADQSVNVEEWPIPAALQRAGVEHRWAVWDDPAEDWAGYDAVLVRSTWDYTEHIDAFRRWVERCASCTTVWNPSPVVLWNSHKSYLLDLADSGIPIVPTCLVRAADLDGAGAAPDATAWLTELADAAGFADAARADGVVVKPAVSVGAIGLSVWQADAAAPSAHMVVATHAIRDLAALGQDVLVQPLVADITSVGETSLVVIDGEATHAVLKVPAAGDIRSQPHLGGRASRVEPATTHVAVARQATHAAAGLAGVDDDDILYARVDCIVRDGAAVLMELELIEPDLFVVFAPEAADALAGALRARVP